VFGIVFPTVAAVLISFLLYAMLRRRRPQHVKKKSSSSWFKLPAMLSSSRLRPIQQRGPGRGRAHPRPADLVHVRRPGCRDGRLQVADRLRRVRLRVPRRARIRSAKDTIHVPKYMYKD
jgi:hypothetical protein